MLVVIAVVGIALGAFVTTSRRSTTFGERARHHAEEIFGIEDEVFPDPAWHAPSGITEHRARRRRMP
jgi:hypothetical protein